MSAPAQIQIQPLAFGGGLVRDVICGNIPNSLRSPAPILLVSGTVVLAVLLNRMRVFEAVKLGETV